MESDSIFSCIHSIQSISKPQELQYRSICFKWLWRDYLFADLLAQAAEPEQTTLDQSLPWWCIVEVEIFDNVKERENQNSTRVMADRLANVMMGRQSANVMPENIIDGFKGYKIRVIGCFSSTAKHVAQRFIELLCRRQMKKSAEEGFQKPDIAIFDYQGNANGGGNWRQRKEPRIRPLSSVQIPRTELETICHDLKTFLASKERLVSMGLKFRRGYLLYGPPGNGKSTFIRAVANELGCNIFNLSVSDPNITDGNWRVILEMCNNCSGILLLEDFDGSFKFDKTGHDQAETLANVDAVNISNKNASSLSYQSILQLLESGIFPFIFMTTNSLETLESMEALNRPGRIDFKLPFRNSTPEQIKGMFMMFYANNRKFGWEQHELEELKSEFNSVLDEARSQVELLKPGEQILGQADELLDDATSSIAKRQKRQCLYERRIQRLEAISAKVSDTAFAEQNAQSPNRRHWLSVLGSMAGNHFQSKLYTYSMAQVEKFFQNMVLGNKRT